MTNRFDTITLRPDQVQFFIDHAMGIALFLVFVILAGTEVCGIRPFALGAALFLGLYLLYEYASLRRMVFIITSETLVCDQGVFYRDSDFIELYRVVDFQERHTLLQQMLGVKTVIVYSGDRTTPKLLIPGISHRVDLVGELRSRVEYNKTRRGVYEITNRF